MAMQKAMKSAWELISPEEQNQIWQKFSAKFHFNKREADSLDIIQPVGSILFDISSIYSDGPSDRERHWLTNRYIEMEADLNRKILESLQGCLDEQKFVYALDWQHPCYRFYPYHMPAVFESKDWKVPVVPNGDYYIFVSPDLEFGVFGHPLKNTICLFGQKFIDLVVARRPKLFSTQIS